MNPANVNTPTHSSTEWGYSPDALAQRKAEVLALLSQVAPEVLSDHQQINVNKLKALLGDEHLAGDEHYELSWAGKAAARREIQKTTSHTLMPSADNPPHAQHMLIEGENLEVLRVLQKSYYGKVKMIYIDPPYNTGNDSFVYPDNYSETLDAYLKRTGEKNEAGFLNKQSLWKKNSKESGQYHSAWLSMMYPRLYLARNLLRDDGVIFISIDDNEAANLKLVCDEVFGAENFVANFLWKKKGTTSNVDGAEVSSLTDSNLCYRKSEKSKILPRITKSCERNYPFNDILGNYRTTVIEKKNDGDYYRQSMMFEILGHKPRVGKRWQIGEERARQLEVKKRFVFDGEKILLKIYDFEDDDSTSAQPNILDNHGSSDGAIKDIKQIFGGQAIFDTPKPVNLISHLIRISSFEDDLILDFFSGSGTTCHAVMELNIADRRNRQSISVQLPEVLKIDTEAYKAGYRTIADITRARIAKVIAKLKAEHPDKTTDLACAHFTLAPSNFKVWRSDITDEKALIEQLALFQSAEKHHHPATHPQTAMLTELLLKHGLGAWGVHAITEPKQIAGVTVHRVLMEDNRRLWLCFETYTEALKDEIVKAKPAQVILLNSCFVGNKADELLSNLQLELSGLDIGLMLI